MKIYKTTKNGYRYDKRIFWGFMLIILAVVFFIAYKNNFDFSYKLTFDCKEKSCINPYYDGNTYASAITGKVKCLEEWCNKKYLDYGFYGPKRPALLNYFWLIVVVMFIASVGLNHILHNRGKKIEVELEGSEWLKKFIDKLNRGV